MTKTESLMADLEQASRIAKAGENTPLDSLAILWVSFAVIGGLGVFILGRQADQKPGAQSVGNRVETYIWIMFSGMMGSLAAGIILNQLLSDGTYQLWDIMIVIGFAGQGLGYGVIAKISKLYWLHLASLAAFIFSAVCFVAYGQTHIYKDKTGATNGNLSTHLTKLEAAGYVRQEKGYKGKRPQTLVHLTDNGRKAWITYLDAMKALLGQ